MSCHKYIPDCQSCSTTDKEINSKLKVVTSAKTLTNFSYLQCDYCEPGKYFNNEKTICEDCSEKFTGCDFCD